MYLEDYVVGAVTRYGRYAVTRDEVVAFARAYDPQPFHLSDEAAAKTHFGRLAASGWHTAAMQMAMLVAEMGADEDSGEVGGSLGAAGIDELRWVKPVYPGDTLHCQSEVIEVTPSRSKPDRGVVRSRITVFNQHDEPVMTMVPIALIRCRPVGA